MKMKRILKKILKGIFFTLLFFVILEIALRIAFSVRNGSATEVPLPYVIGHDYGPIPPWLDDLMMFAPDDDLIWKNRPNLQRRYVDIFSPAHTDEERRSLLRQFSTTLPEAWKDNPTWEVVLSSEGFRDDEPTTKAASAFRIVCMGDSWTFGMNVNQDESYPKQLHKLFREHYPKAEFDVLNRGVLAYSSHQGLVLLKKRVLDLKPDVIVIGYAMNDLVVRGFSDEGFAAYEQDLPWKERLSRFFKKSVTYRTLDYTALVLKHQPKPLGDFIKEKTDNISEGQPQDGEDPYAWTQWSRVPREVYEKNLLAMIRLARERGSAVVLLYNEFWQDGPYQRVLDKIAKAENVPLVNSSMLLAAARRQVEQDLEKKLGLQPGTDTQPYTNGNVEVVFRVYLSERPVSKGIYIAGAHPELGDLAPNKVAMYDDGTHGDQKAGDGVWSCTVSVAPGTPLCYVYTNSGTEGIWEGLDVPYIREFQVDAKPKTKTILRPIESFGKIYLQGDPAHPNAQGYALIAKSVFETIQKTDGFSKHVNR